MHDPIANNVIRRFLASHAPVAADSRFTPPRGIVNGVDTGELPVECLNIWKYVVEYEGERFNPKNPKSWAATVQHWRNKCAKMGIVLPKKYIEELGGEGGAGRWSAKTGEQIEDWVRETIKSKQLLDQVGRSCYDWKLWIAHYEKKAAEAQELIDKHIKGMAEAKTDKGVAQRKKWLEGARKDLSEQIDQLEKARKALASLEEQAQRYNQSQVPTIEFEKEFQFMLLLALKEFDKKQVLEAVQTAIQRVEQGLDIPGGYPSTEGLEGYRTAGVMDALTKAWDFLVDKFEQFVDWMKGLLGLTNRIEKMMNEAGAP